VYGNSLTITGLAVNIDASALETPLYLDGVRQATPVLTAKLLPGRHGFVSNGGATQYFNIADDGTLSLENTRLGSVSGHTLTIRGLTVSIDASALGISSLTLDSIVYQAGSITVNVLPGRHSFFIRGSTSLYFDVADDGYITIPATENGILSIMNGTTLRVNQKW
jgi:hypothetical protein